MKNEPLISIVIPVYRCEDFLRPCIDSIIAQSFTDWELILVDDGTPDNAGAICDEYATRDSRIRVFHKENGGATSARKYGVEHAQGSWIFFSDSDDYLTPNALKSLSSKVTDNVDMVIGTCLYRNSQVLYFTQPTDTWATKEDYIKYLLDHSTPIGPGSKLIRKELFKYVHWIEDRSVFNHEDLYMLICLVAHSSGRILIDNESVHYICNDREGTISSRTMSYPAWCSLFRSMYDVLDQSDMMQNPEVSSAFLHYVTRTLRRMCTNRGIWYSNDSFIEFLKSLYAKYNYPRSRQTDITVNPFYRMMAVLASKIR